MQMTTDSPHKLSITNALMYPAPLLGAQVENVTDYHRCQNAEARTLERSGRWGTLFPADRRLVSCIASSELIAVDWDSPA